MSVKVTFANPATDDLPNAVNTVIADYVIDNSGDGGLTRGKIVERCLFAVDHDEVGHWEANDTVTPDVASAYHQLLDAVAHAPAALDRAVFGNAPIQHGHAVQFRATDCTPDRMAGRWYAGGMWKGAVLDTTPDSNGEVLVGWGGKSPILRSRYRQETRINPALLLNP